MLFLVCWICGWIVPKVYHCPIRHAMLDLLDFKSSWFVIQTIFCCFERIDIVPLWKMSVLSESLIHSLTNNLSPWCEFLWKFAFFKKFPLLIGLYKYGWFKFFNLLSCLSFVLLVIKRPLLLICIHFSSIFPLTRSLFCENKNLVTDFCPDCNDCIKLKIAVDFGNFLISTGITIPEKYFDSVDFSF